jgi:serine/threonine protein kinase
VVALWLPRLDRRDVVVDEPRHVGEQLPARLVAVRAEDGGEPLEQRYDLLGVDARVGAGRDGELGGRPYLALQHCARGSLAEQHRDLGRSERARLLQRVALAADAAHRIGLIHRDLEPSTILLEDEPTGGVIPPVADFGLARAVDAATRHTGSVVGTPAYMSPEQAEGRRDLGTRAPGAAPRARCLTSMARAARLVARDQRVASACLMRWGVIGSR